MDQPKVKSIKKFVGFSRLSRSATINLILFYFITSAELGAIAKVKKCCPRDQVFSVTDNYICAYYGDRKHQLYPLRSRRIRDENFFSCVNLTSGFEWTITDIRNNTHKVINAQNTCVDLSYDARLGTCSLTAFQCHHRSNGTNENEEDENEIGGPTEYLERTWFKTLRMCCGRNRYFDRELQACAMSREEVNVTRFLNFLDGAFDFVTVVAGPPVCKYAILDFTVNVTTDLRVLANDSIEVSNSLIAGIWCFFI